MAVTWVSALGNGGFTRTSTATLFQRGKVYVAAGAVKVMAGCSWLDIAYIAANFDSIDFFTRYAGSILEGVDGGSDLHSLNHAYDSKGQRVQA